MMKIFASLVILGLCANVAFALNANPVGTSQGSAFSGLNSVAQKVYTAANSTDATNWNPTVVSTTVSVALGIPASQVIFGPGASNDTSYVYGYSYTSTSGIQSLTSIVVRTLSNTIVAYGNDSTNAQPFTKSESKISSSILATSATFAVGPGVLAILSYGTDSTSNEQIYYTLVSGTTAAPVKVTSTADVVAGTGVPAVGVSCTTTSFGLGNIWYDQGAEAFFYTYSKSVATDSVLATVSSGTGTCGGSPATVNNIYLGAVYANGTTAITTPLALSIVTPANSISSLTSGPDNYLNATNIYVVYKDTSVSTGGANSATGIIYQQKIAKSSAPTAGSFSALVSDTIVGTIVSSTASTSVVTTTNTPLSVWASNFTYGIAVANVTETQTAAQYPSTSGAMAYTISNYLNSTLTWADSGISYSSALGVGALYGWQLTTGYTLVAQWLSSTASTPDDTYAYTWGTFYGNGTVNATSTTLGSVQGPVSFYEDVNGTMWVGWTDVETVNSPTMTYAGYLAKLQGQLNVPSGASILSAISAFFALFLAAIFVF